jgi:hypothetical protein
LSGMTARKKYPPHRISNYHPCLVYTLGVFSGSASQPSAG